MLEPYDGKLSCTVLRREGGGNTADPADYYPLVEALGGQVIHISSTSRDYINPMDINLNYADDDNPLGMKSDFILSLCELIMGARDGSCLLYTSPSPRDRTRSRMPSSA